MANNPYVNKVNFGNQTIMDISDSTIAEDNVLLNYQGYSASGNKITGKVGITVENGIMKCNGPLFSVSNHKLKMDINVTNNILHIG